MARIDSSGSPMNAILFQSAIRVEPPEGFRHFYPHGTVFPEDEPSKISKKEEGSEKREETRSEGVAEGI